MEKPTKGLEGVWTELEVCEEFGLTKDQLTALREKGLPWLAVNERVRLYLEEDLVECLRGLRTTYHYSPRKESAQ